MVITKLQKEKNENFFLWNIFSFIIKRIATDISYIQKQKDI